MSYPVCPTALQADKAEAVAGLEARITELAGQLAEQQGAAAALEAALGASLQLVILGHAKLLALIKFKLFVLTQESKSFSETLYLKRQIFCLVKGTGHFSSALLRLIKEGLFMNRAMKGVLGCAVEMQACMEAASERVQALEEQATQQQAEHEQVSSPQYTRNRLSHIRRDEEARRENLPPTLLLAQGRMAISPGLHDHKQ